MDNPNVVAFQPLGPSAWNYEDTWSTGLCACGENGGECCYAFFCGPCFFCHLTWRLRESCWVLWCSPMPLGALRTKIRTMFRIEGSICGDCCITTMCSICSALQMSRELQIRGIL